MVTPTLMVYRVKTRRSTASSSLGSFHKHWPSCPYTWVLTTGVCHLQTHGSSHTLRKQYGAPHKVLWLLTEAWVS